MAIVPPECLGAADVGACNLQALVGVFTRVANFLFGIAGSLALLYFIYGGYVWLTSAGKSDKISEGKTIITNAVIGLIIVVGAWAFVGLALQAVQTGQGLVIEGAQCAKKVGNITPHGVKIKGEAVCVKDCSELKQLTGLNYQCTGENNPPPAGAVCEKNLCSGGTNDVCCISGFVAETTCNCYLAPDIYTDIDVTVSGKANCATLSATYDKSQGGCVIPGSAAPVSTGGLSDEAAKNSCASLKCKAKTGGGEIF